MAYGQPSLLFATSSPVPTEGLSYTQICLGPWGALCKFPVFGMHSLHKWRALQDVNVPFESENSE